MTDKPLVIATDPFAGRPFARLARRRLLQAAGGTIDALIVAPSPATRDRRAAVARCRRSDVLPLLAIHPMTVPDAGRLARRAAADGFAGVVIATAANAAAAAAMAAAALPHLRVLLDVADADIGAVGDRVPPSVDVVWRPRSALVPAATVAAVAAMIGRAPIIELPAEPDPGRPALEPALRLRPAIAAGAAGVLLHPPALPEAASIWLAVATSPDPDALTATLARRLGPAVAARLVSLAFAVARCGTPADLLLARRAYDRGDDAPLRRTLGAWLDAGDVVARLGDRRLAREIAPLASLLHALGEAGLHALDGDPAAAWEIYTARVDGRDAVLGPAAASLLDSLTPASRAA
jgi:hypothetical protein